MNYGYNMNTQNMNNQNMNSQKINNQIMNYNYHFQEQVDENNFPTPKKY